MAFGMSGTYDLSRYLDGRWNDDFYYSSPLHYLPGLPEGAQLDDAAPPLHRARNGLRTVGKHRGIVAHGQRARRQGRFRIASTTGASRYDHDWPTWREMLPQYLAHHV